MQWRINRRTWGARAPPGCDQDQFVPTPLVLHADLPGQVGVHQSSDVASTLTHTKETGLPFDI